MSLIVRIAFAIKEYFWVLWGLGLIGSVGTALYLDNRFRRPFGIQKPASAVFWPGASASLLFAVFFVAYVGFMLWDEQFTYHDHATFIDFSVSGKPYEPPIWLSSGRFWPLGYQEYNLLGRLSPAATTYLALGAIQLLAVLTLLILTLKEQPLRWRLAMLVVLMLAPAFAATYAEITYAERNVIFWFCILFFAIQRHETEQSRFWLVAGVVAAGVALYYKETAFPLIGGFIASRLLLKALRTGPKSVLGLPIEVGTLIACLGYLGLLAIVLFVTHFVSGETSYVASVSEGMGSLRSIARYLTSDLLVAAFLVAFGADLVARLRAKRALDPLWDALAIGGILHLAAISSTGIWEDYLLGPTELVAAVTLLRLSYRWWHDLARPGRALLMATGIVIFLGSTGFGLFRLIERKNVVWETAELAEYLIQYYQEPEALQSRLYFPSAPGGRTMWLLSLLRSRGLPIALSDEPARGKIVVAGAASFENDLCVSNRNYVCHHDAPVPGDLVVFLPEDRGREVFPMGGVHLEPMVEFLPFGMPSSPANPMSFFFRISPVFDGNPMPENWPHASISRATVSEAH